MSEFYSIITENGQSLVDIAIEKYGCFEGVFTLLQDNPALLNNITAVFSAGHSLNIRNDISFLPAQLREYATFMRAKGKRINTHNDSTLPAPDHSGDTSFAVTPFKYTILLDSGNDIFIQFFNNGTVNGLVPVSNVDAITDIELWPNGDSTSAEEISLGFSPFSVQNGDILKVTVDRTNELLPATVEVNGFFASTIISFNNSNMSAFAIDTEFSSIINCDNNYIMAQHNVNGAINFTKKVGAAHKVGRMVKASLVANGVNKPTFSADFIKVRDNWVNTNGTLNRIFFEYQANGKILYEIIYV